MILSFVNNLTRFEGCRSVRNAAQGDTENAAHRTRNNASHCRGRVPVQVDIERPPELVFERFQPKLCEKSGLAAGVAEWQTQGTQNPPPARACEFDSHLRYQSSRMAHGQCRCRHEATCLAPVTAVSSGSEFRRRLESSNFPAVRID